MNEALLRTLHSLAAIMREETELLARGPATDEVAPLAAAKLRLIGVLEAVSADVAGLARNTWRKRTRGPARSGRRAS